MTLYNLISTHYDDGAIVHIEEEKNRNEIFEGMVFNAIDTLSISTLNSEINRWFVDDNYTIWVLI